MPVATAPAYVFTGRNPRAVRAAERQGAKLVTAVTEQVREAIRVLISQSIRDGIPVLDAARILRNMLGMTAPQAQAALNYRRELVDSGLSEVRVDTLVDKYVEKKIKERALVVARTEIMAALNRGTMEAYAEARASGLLGAVAKREWITTPDEKLCPSCAPMDGRQVLLGDPFMTPDGLSDGPPLHPNCRCSQVAVA